MYVKVEITEDQKKRHGLGVDTKVTKRILKSVRDEWTEQELLDLKVTQEHTDDETGLYNEHGPRKRPLKTSRQLDRGVYDEEQSLELLNPLFAAPSSKLREMARCLVRLETLSHVLFWKKITKLSPDDFNQVDLVELPRLQLTLTERNGFLFSIDHSDLRVCSEAYLLQRPEVVKLCQGIPHSLVMVNSNEEPHVLIPLVRVVRPAIGSSPLTTELVLDRVNWGGLATKYLLLPVHISLSFLQTPSLASALYLLNLRFVNRDYGDCMRLVSSVGTDTMLTKEEESVIRSISAVKDDHPNAHSLRLHLTLALMDAPDIVKTLLTWDVPDQQYLYMNKLSYVAMSSRLGKRAEADCVDSALEQIRKEDVIKSVLRSFPKEQVEAFAAYLFDPAVAEEVSFQEKKRFDDMMEQLLKAIEESLQLASASVSVEEVKRLIPKAMQKQRSAFQRCSLRNRKRWLATEVEADCVMELPDRAKTSNWQWWTDDTITTADASHWLSAEFKYGCPRGLSGLQLLQSVNGVVCAQHPESMTGAVCRMGFLFLYEMLSGSCRIKVGANDDSLTIARLLWHYYGDAHDKTLWSSIISLIVANPHIRTLLPRFRDNRTSKTEVFLGTMTDSAPISPLNTLLLELVPIMQSMYATLNKPTIPRRSAVRPPRDLDPTHSGLTVVTASSFEQLVLGQKRVFLDVYADWCGPCQAVKPEVIRVAKVFDELKVADLLIAKCDSDANDMSQYITEGYIPVLKFYSPGAEPQLYEGKRTANAIIEFLHGQCDGTSSEFDLEEALEELAVVISSGYPQTEVVAIDKPEADKKQTTMKVSSLIILVNSLEMIIIINNLEIYVNDNFYILIY